VFDGHGHDVWGILAIVVGLVAALGIYADIGGPVGRGLGQGIGVAVGLVAWIIPPTLVAIGVVLVRGPRLDSAGTTGRGADRSADDASGPTDAEIMSAGRLVVGSVLLIVAACGFFHLLRGRPTWGDPIHDLVRAGGALGIVVGGSLGRLLGVWGAGLVLIALGVVGVLIISRTSVRAAAGRTAAGVRPLTGALSRAFAPLFEVGDRSDAEGTADGAAIDLRDPATTEAEPKPKRSRKAALPTAPRNTPQPTPMPMPMPTTPMPTTMARSRSSSSPSGSARPPSGRPGSCRRRSCCAAPRCRRSTAPPSRNAAGPSKAPSPPTAWRPGSSAWSSARPSPATSSSSGRA
jgi:S-DNA-T family DNA segregation ATPase FtsK/SpoIIIE